MSHLPSMALAIATLINVQLFKPVFPDFLVLQPAGLLWIIAFLFITTLKMSPFALRAVVLCFTEAMLSDLYLIRRLLRGNGKGIETPLLVLLARRTRLRD